MNENELVNLTINTDSDQITISARELYERLEISERFSKWFDRMKGYGFKDGEDFTSVPKSTEVLNNGGIQIRDLEDFAISLDMAKQICMLQRSERGKQYREYFIQLEKAWNSPEKVMSRALNIAHKQIASLNEQIEIMKPKALFADAVSASETSISIGELAKILRQKGCEIGRNRLFQWMRDNGYLMYGSEGWNVPTQYAMERGWLEIQERTIQSPDGSVRITQTPKITSKGQRYFVERFCGKGTES